MSKNTNHDLEGENMEIEWAYLRKGWQSCIKAQKFFEQNRIQIRKRADARKDTIAEEAALELIRSFKKIVVGRGKKILEFKPAQDNINEIMKVSLGRTGNLRAPAVQSGDILYVGFNDRIYEDLQ